MENIMKTILFLLTVCFTPLFTTVVHAEAPNPIVEQKILTQKEIAEGTIALFDGKTLFGWEAGKGINWTVENGTITADSGPVGLIRTKVPFKDFELRVQCKLEQGGNSGIFVRSLATPKDPTTDCYEINVADVHKAGYTSGSIIGHVKTDVKFPANEWLAFKIRVVGSHVTVHINGKKTADYCDKKTDASSRRFGYIGLQKNSGKVAFRNVVLKPLEAKSIFNGKDLTGWREVPGSKSQFTVEDGVIRSRNGLGFIETEKQYGDFILQADVKTHAKELNSGIFFRTEKGTEKANSNGYELQIHNGFKEGGRNKPNNAGTGSIFRRTVARRIVANDGDWCTLTLIAFEAEFGIWVDGYQTTSWKDRRKQNANPRKGLRLEKGHFSLQGHDPTTDLSFRRFRVTTFEK